MGGFPPKFIIKVGGFLKTGRQTPVHPQVMYPPRELLYQSTVVINNHYCFYFQIELLNNHYYLSPITRENYCIIIAIASPATRQDQLYIIAMRLLRERDDSLFLRRLSEEGSHFLLPEKTTVFLLCQLQVYVPQNIHKIYLLNKILGKIFFSHFFVLLYAPTY